MSTTNTPRGVAPVRKKPAIRKLRAVAPNKPHAKTYKGAKKLTAKRVRDPSGTLSVLTLLGGDEVMHAQPRTFIEWIDVIREGIPSSAAEIFARRIHVSQSEFSTFLNIPERTLVRRKGEGVLNSEESAKLVRMARVVERASEVFDELDAALDWLKSPNAALSGAIPMSLLDTEIGAKAVMDTLGRIEHGVFA